MWQNTKVAAVKGQLAAEATRKTANDIKVSVNELRQENMENHEILASHIDQTKRALEKQFQDALNRLIALVPPAIHEAMQGQFHQLTADSIYQRSK